MIISDGTGVRRAIPILDNARLRRTLHTPVGSAGQLPDRKGSLPRGSRCLQPAVPVDDLGRSIGEVDGPEVVVAAVADVVREELLSRFVVSLSDEDGHEIQSGGFVVR